MDTEILWILMVTNILNNSSKLIKRLGISQEKFLKYSSYAAKSSLKRVIEAEGKDSSQEKESETPKEVVTSEKESSQKEVANPKDSEQKKEGKPKKDVGYTREKATEIIKKELDRRMREAFPDKEEQYDEKDAKKILTDYRMLLDWASIEEKFVESMVMAIDSFIFFAKSDDPTIHSVTALALYNELIVKDDPIALVAPSDPTPTPDPLATKMEYIFDDEIGKKCEFLTNKYWYKVDYPNGRGLTYQLQYFKYYKNFGTETFKYKPIFEVIEENRRNAFTIISPSGFLKLQPLLGSVLNVLRENGWSTNVWPIVQKDDAFDSIMPENEPLKFLLPVQEGFNQLYYNILPDPEGSSLYEWLPEFPDDTLGSWTVNMTLAQRTITSIQTWFRYIQEKVFDAYILLFVSSIDEMQRLSKEMDPAMYRKTIFAYLSSIVPDDDTEDKCVYFTFARGQESYSYAIELKIEEE